MRAVRFARALQRKPYTPQHQPWRISAAINNDTININQQRRTFVQLPNSQQNLPGQDDESPPDPKDNPSSTSWGATFYRMFESSMTTLASVAVLGLVGYSYTRYYKHLVLEKMENAFKPGDPVLQLADKRSRPTLDDDSSDRSHWIDRAEQARLDDIVSGKVRGQYYLLVGEKGTGKSSMLIDAMAKINGEGCAMFEAHADLEIFRVRLGKALDFEYHEDNIGSLFSIRGPRDASALLDIERAFNKLEKVALKRRDAVGRPLIIIINSTHLMRDDEDGRDLLELIQQRAGMSSDSLVSSFLIPSRHLSPIVLRQFFGHVGLVLRCFVSNSWRPRG